MRATITFKDKKGRTIVLERMDKEGKVYLTRDLMSKPVAFNKDYKKKDASQYEGSDIQKYIQNWTKENVPVELLEEFEVGLPHIEELFGENRFEAIKKDRRKRKKTILGKKKERGVFWDYWTDSPCKDDINFVRFVFCNRDYDYMPGGCIAGGHLVSVPLYFPLCFRKK